MIDVFPLILSYFTLQDVFFGLKHTTKFLRRMVLGNLHLFPVHSIKTITETLMDRTKHASYVLPAFEFNTDMLLSIHPNLNGCLPRDTDLARVLKHATIKLTTIKSLLHPIIVQQLLHSNIKLSPQLPFDTTTVSCDKLTNVESITLENIGACLMFGEWSKPQFSNSAIINPLCVCAGINNMVFAYPLLKELSIFVHLDTLTTLPPNLHTFLLWSVACTVDLTTKMHYLKSVDIACCDINQQSINNLILTSNKMQSVAVSVYKPALFRVAMLEPFTKKLTLAFHRTDAMGALTLPAKAMHCSEFYLNVFFETEDHRLHVLLATTYFPQCTTLGLGFLGEEKASILCFNSAKMFESLCRNTTGLTGLRHLILRGSQHSDHIVPFDIDGATYSLLNQLTTLELRCVHFGSISEMADLQTLKLVIHVMDPDDINTDTQRFCLPKFHNTPRLTTLAFITKTTTLPFNIRTYEPVPQSAFIPKSITNIELPEFIQPWFTTLEVDKITVRFQQYHHHGRIRLFCRELDIVHFARDCNHHEKNKYFGYLENNVVCPWLKKLTLTFHALHQYTRKTVLAHDFHFIAEATIEELKIQRSETDVFTRVGNLKTRPMFANLKVLHVPYYVQVTPMANVQVFYF